jgi:hypothetical protein
MQRNNTTISPTSRLATPRVPAHNALKTATPRRRGTRLDLSPPSAKPSNAIRQSARAKISSSTFLRDPR